MKRKRLGDVLRERGHISPADLTKTIEDQQGKLVHLGELMLERGFVSKQDLAAALTEVTRVPYVDCEKVRIEPDALKLLPYALAKRCCALPLEILSPTKLLMVMAEPQNLGIIDELQFSTGMEIVARLAFRDEIEKAIEKWYSAAKQAGGTGAEANSQATDSRGIEFISSSSLRRNVEATQEMQAELLQKCTPAVRLVASIITAAADKQASDIHLEPQATDTVVRFRVDGILRDYQRIPQSLQSSAVSRIKILSNMDIAERTTPQHGRFLVKIADRRFDLRVSTLPTQYGEKVVLRVLGATAPLQDFTALGLSEDVADELRRMLCLPQGLILVTGPTGAGKSTTLYSCLNLLRNPAINIVTVEDQPEYSLPGINQVQVNAKNGVAGCLRSVLRQDPNVILIGEIRDQETAELALKAAQTGQLVLSALHTNDSVSAITRMADLGLAASQIAAPLIGILAQRLIRRLCDCHKVVATSPETASRLKAAGVTRPPEMESVPVGCEVCDLTGYKGRIGIFELLAPSDSVRAAIRSGKRNDEIRVLARQNGMKVMQECAIERVREGLTTLEEVLRVVPFDPISSSRCSACDCEILPAFLFCPYCGAKAPQPTPAKPRKRALLGQGAATE